MAEPLVAASLSPSNQPHQQTPPLQPAGPAAAPAARPRREAMNSKTCRSSCRWSDLLIAHGPCPRRTGIPTLLSKHLYSLTWCSDIMKIEIKKSKCIWAILCITEKNDTGGVSEEGECIWLDGVAQGDLGQETGTYLFYCWAVPKRGRGTVIYYCFATLYKWEFSLVCFPSFSCRHLSLSKRRFLCLLNNMPTSTYEKRQGKWPGRENRCWKRSQEMKKGGEEKLKNAALAERRGGGTKRWEPWPFSPWLASGHQ